MAKVPASLIPLASMKHSPELTAADLQAAAEAKAAAASTPPDRDCSTISCQEEQQAEVGVGSHDSTVEQNSTCVDFEMTESVASEPTLTVFTPVQTQKTEPAAGGHRSPGTPPKDAQFQRPERLLASG